ncbi:cell wall-binding repeat-containing protein [Peptacetobacter sp.]|uniref:cell wall-binding repeat-containing protein n=1 Tax=Peptacetobacter sp. TaxID=2991975 RepID=UPI002627406C|nr:cell wall-binding repeat-containing protein [Peptacetobacter sp.]
MNFKKVMSVCMASTILAGSFATVNAAEKEVIQGKNMYETAGLIADKQKYDSVILVNLDNSIADGLSASGLSGAANAPILLTKKDSIPEETLKRLKNVKKVYIIGLEAAISKKVEDKLKCNGISVERLGGSNRNKTSYSVADKISELKNITSVAITNGTNGEADSISIASTAARDAMPVILTNGKTIDFNIKNKKVYAIGGTSVISNSLVKSTNAERLGGSNRYKTNEIILNKFYPNVNEYYVADGYDLKNALVGSTLAKDAPLMLVSKGSDKSVFKGASKISKIGNLSYSIYEDCLRRASSNNINNIAPIKENFDILSEPTSTYEQCRRWAESKRASDLFMEILPILYNTAVENGVDPTLVVAQCAKETGYCKFGGVLDASFKNTCGLKTPNGGGDYDKNAHTRFDSWEEGALAQVQHLALYAGKEGYPLENPKDPRHFADLFGKCKTVKSLSNNWAGSSYGEDLEKMMKEIVSK